MYLRDKQYIWIKDFKGFFFVYKYLRFVSSVFELGLKMVWNVGRISNIVFCPKSPNFYQYLNYTQGGGNEERKKMFDFRYFNARWGLLGVIQGRVREGGRYCEYKINQSTWCFSNEQQSLPW